MLSEMDMRNELTNSISFKKARIAMDNNHPGVTAGFLYSGGIHLIFTVRVFHGLKQKYKYYLTVLSILVIFIKVKLSKGATNYAKKNT